MPWINNRGYMQERITDPHTGLERVVSVKCSGKGEKARQEAHRRLQNKIQKLSETRFLFSTVIDLYLKEFGPLWKPSSLTRVNSHFRQMKKILGDAYMDTMTAGFVRMKFAESGKSNRTLNDYQETLKTFWRWAYRNDFVKTQELADKLMSLPDQPVKERIQDKYLEPWELKKLLDAIPEKRDALFVRFLALTGMRVSEAIALNDSDVWGDIIRIDKTYDESNHIITTPKSVKSRREIHVQPELKECIDEMREYVAWEKRIFEFQTGIFFPDLDGTYFEYSRFNRHIAEVAEEVLGRRITTHYFRHTHCSMLVAKGASYEMIIARLGHEDSKITKEIYTHRLKELKDKENKFLDSVRLIQ